MTHRAHVLVIDSEADSRTETTSAVRRGGCSVTSAADGDVGLMALNTCPPDLVIVSSDLPSMRGEEAYLRIRQASLLPMIVLGRHEDDREVLEAGIDAYMTKPPNARELSARVRSLLWRASKHVVLQRVAARTDVGGNGSDD